VQRVPVAYSWDTCLKVTVQTLLMTGAVQVQGRAALSLRSFAEVMRGVRGGWEIGLDAEMASVVKHSRRKSMGE